MRTRYCYNCYLEEPSLSGFFFQLIYFIVSHESRRFESDSEVGTTTSNDVEYRRAS